MYDVHIVLAVYVPWGIHVYVRVVTCAHVQYMIIYILVLLGWTALLTLLGAVDGSTSNVDLL